MFRAKKLDLGCFVNIKVIRDHTKRKVYEKHEAERYVHPFRPETRTEAIGRALSYLLAHGMSRRKRSQGESMADCCRALTHTDRRSATSSATRPSRRACAQRPSCS